MLISGHTVDERYNTIIIVCLLAQNKAHLYKRHARNDRTSNKNFLFSSFNPVYIKFLNNARPTLVGRSEDNLVDVSKASLRYIDILLALLRRKEPV